MQIRARCAMAGSLGRALAAVLLLAMGWRPALAAPPPPPAENEQARAAWMAGYVKFEEAQKAEAANNQVVALDLYREALETFTQVKARFPNWNPSLLDFRINFCRERCRRLETTVAAKNVTLSREELVSLSRNQQEQVAALRTESLEQQKKLELLGQSLERARSEAAGALTAQNQLAQLLDENKGLKAAAQSAAEREKKLAAEVALLQSDSGLKAQAERLQQQLDATRARQAALESGAESQKRDLEALRTQLRDATLERERLQRELAALKAQRDDGAGEAGALRRQNSALEEKIAALEQASAALRGERARADQLTQDALAQIRTANAELARLRPLEAQLAARTADLERARGELAAAQAAPGTPAAPEPDATAALQARLAETEKALAAAQEQHRRLADQHDLATRELAARDVALAAAQRQAADLTRERDQGTALLDAVQKRANALAAQVNVFEAERARMGQADGERQAQAEAARQRAAASEAALAALQQRHDEGVRLARRQEERLAALEKSVSARDTTLRESEARLQALSARLVEQQDLAAALEGARQAAVQAQAEAEAAGRRAAASETRLSESQKETTALREALAKARAGQATDAELRAHLEAAERAAEQERGKVRLLEQALAERAAAAPAPPAASTETADGAWRELRQQVAVLEIKLDDRDKEVKVLREELAKERTARAPADDPLLDELRTLNRELDRERERVRKLEQALVQQAGRGTTAMVVPGLPAALAPAPSPADMALGFLQTAAGAEQQGRTETAIWNYRKALEYEPANRLALKRLGLLAAQAGNDEDAADFLRRAFYGDPDDVDILLPLGFALVRQGQVDLALSSLARAAALRPDDAGVHRAYGVACSTLGWPDAAEAQLRRAFQIDPQDGEAAFNLAVLLAARKPPRLQEARGWYGKARTLGVAADPGLDRLFGEKENTKP